MYKNWTVVKYERNKPYNNLPQLPQANNLQNDSEVLMQLVKSSRALAKFDGNVFRLPNPNMLVNTIALQEAKTSTEIENIFTTEDELYQAISENSEKNNTNPATKEVLKYREALWTGYGQVSKGEKLNNRLLINIFQQIKETKSEFRSPQSLVVIKRGQSEFKSGEAIYTPPSGNKIESMLKNLWNYINNDHKHTIDPLIKMCISHYQLEAIHPFTDGNGRAGRILNLLILVDKGLITHPALYLSKYILQNKDDYYFALSGVTQRNDWKDWVMFMLKAVEVTSNITNGMIQDIISQMESTLTYGREKIKWYTKEINEAIFTQPYIKAKVIGDITGKTSRTTLTKYMEELVRHQILRVKKSGTQVYYVNDDLMRILGS